MTYIYVRDSSPLVISYSDAQSIVGAACIPASDVWIEVLSIFRSQSEYVDYASQVIHRRGVRQSRERHVCVIYNPFSFFENISRFL